MTVKELIEALQQREQNLEVFSYCDHGQQPEKSMYPCVVWFDNEYEEYALDKETADSMEYTNKAILL